MGTVPAFRIGGVPIRLHFTFILLLAFLVVSDLGHESSGTFALYLIGLFASVILHELAHAGVASRLRVRTLEIVMFPIGGLARLERRLRPAEELWVTLAGPAANLAIAGGDVRIHLDIASIREYRNGRTVAAHRRECRTTVGVRESAAGRAELDAGLPHGRRTSAASLAQYGSAR